MINRRDGNVHVAVLHSTKDSVALAKVKWDPEYKCNNGLIGAWLIISINLKGEWKDREKPVHYSYRKDLEWEEY